jgi:16S rRNA (adenine1518-N6/adenine1519-N6)-dimethyltransferase
MLPLLRAELLVNEISNVEVLSQDMLSLDMSALAKDQARSLTILGNLPYNISSQVVIKLIDARHCIDRAVLMFQKELAERLCACPGSRTYGRISVMLQYCARIKVLRQVPAEMFFPKPKVDSVVLGIEFQTDPCPEAADEELMGRVVKAAFGQRRKTLQNALAAGLKIMDKGGAARVLEAAGIDPRRRAETLTVAEFVALSDCVGRYVL